MDESIVDVLARLVIVSRRRAAASTLLAALAPLDPIAFDAAATKRKKRKPKKRKRCVKLLKPCRVGGRRCCHRHVCQSFDTGANGTFFCCKGQDQPCTASAQCCPPLACGIEAGSTVGTCGNF